MSDLSQFPYDPDADMSTLQGLDRLRAVEDRVQARYLFNLWTNAQKRPEARQWAILADGFTDNPRDVKLRRNVMRSVMAHEFVMRDGSDPAQAAAKQGLNGNSSEADLAKFIHGIRKKGFTRR